jgi:hypothetical protein
MHCSLDENVDGKSALLCESFALFVMMEMLLQNIQELCLAIILAGEEAL